MTAADLEEELRDIIEVPFCPYCGEPMILLPPLDEEPPEAIEVLTAVCPSCGRFRVATDMENNWARP